MLKTRAAFLLVVAPLAFAVPASADPTVPGCWGAGANSYCDATVRVETGETGSEPTPVCAYSCVYVDVPTVGIQQAGAKVCLDYRTPSGTATSDCVGRVYDTTQLAQALVNVVCDRGTKPPEWCEG